MSSNAVTAVPPSLLTFENIVDQLITIRNRLEIIADETERNERYLTGSSPAVLNSASQSPPADGAIYRIQEQLDLIYPFIGRAEDAIRAVDNRFGFNSTPPKAISASVLSARR